jgi:hypothetical protein
MSAIRKLAAEAADNGLLASPALRLTISAAPAQSDAALAEASLSRSNYCWAMPRFRRQNATLVPSRI